MLKDRKDKQESFLSSAADTGRICTEEKHFSSLGGRFLSFSRSFRLEPKFSGIAHFRPIRVANRTRRGGISSLVCVEALLFIPFLFIILCLRHVAFILRLVHKKIEYFFVFPGPASESRRRFLEFLLLLPARCGSMRIVHCRKREIFL